VGILDFFRRSNDPRKDQLREALSECDVLFANEFYWAEIRAVIEQELKKPLPPELRFEKPKHPHRFLTRALWALVSDRLRSGELHVYRGVLSGRGQGYRSIAGELCSHMTAYGDMRGSEMDDALDELDQDILEAG